MPYQKYNTSLDMTVIFGLMRDELGDELILPHHNREFEKRN